MAKSLRQLRDDARRLRELLNILKVGSERYQKVWRKLRDTKRQILVLESGQASEGIKTDEQN